MYTFPLQIDKASPDLPYLASPTPLLHHLQVSFPAIPLQSPPHSLLNVIYDNPGLVLHHATIGVPHTGAHEDRAPISAGGAAEPIGAGDVALGIITNHIY